MSDGGPISAITDRHLHLSPALRRMESELTRIRGFK
jgi:hypothetical protein